MKFSVLAEAFQSIEQSSGRLDKTKILAEILQQATPQETELFLIFLKVFCFLHISHNNFKYLEKALLLF